MSVQSQLAYRYIVSIEDKDLACLVHINTTYMTEIYPRTINALFSAVYFSLIS
jgi:hypothetical protein